MKSTTYTSEDLCRMKYIVLGRQMENNYRQITFDLSDILEEIPDVETISLVHMRSRDLGEYPAVTSSESPLVWTITDTDTAYYGYGKAEIRFTFGDGGLAKTLTFQTLVFKSITADTVIPEPLQSWYDALIDYIDEHSVSPEQIEQAVADYLDEHPVEAPVTSVNGEIGAVVLTASDVGALPDTYTAPVTSVNTKTGAVVLTASDVGALPSSTQIPTKTSDLTNDSGFLSSAVTTWNGQSGAVTYTAPVTKVNNKTGAVTLTASDVGALPSTYTAPVASVDGKTGAVTILPTGGSSGQVLTKRTGSNYDVTWQTVSGGGAVDSVNGQTGTVVLTASDVGALPDTTDVEDVYWCTYGTTTSAQIETALNAGKIPMVSYNNYVYTLRNRNSATNHRFVCNYGGKEYTVVCQSGTWMPDGTLTFLTTSYTAPVTSVNGQTGAVTTPNTTYTFSISSNVITITPSSGTVQTITLPVYNGGVI